MNTLRKMISGIALLLALCGLLTAGAADGAVIEIMQDNTFWFGAFEQDNNLGNGDEPILWRILDVDWSTDQLLVLSEYGLHTMNYHHSDSRTAWADTDVRAWLNQTFAARAFSPEESKHIAVSRVSGSMDRVFLLDADQVRKYLKEPYLCTATPYAIACGAYVNKKTGTSSWLLRTDVAEGRIAWVGGAGALYLPSGSKGVNYLTTADNVVRPAMWVSRSEITDELEGEFIPVNTAAPQRSGLTARTLDTTIATRSGPSTGYNGIGSYKDIYEVKVLSRASDGSVMWLLVEFQYQGLTVRCYTGAKRVNIDVSIVPDEPDPMNDPAVVIRQPAAYYGPGKLYKKQVEKFTPPVGTEGRVLWEENGWYCFEYTMQDGGHDVLVRVWLQPEDIAFQ